MKDVPLYRLYMLRAMYLLVAVAMGSQVWPEIVAHAASWENWEGVTQSLAMVSRGASQHDHVGRW